MTEVKGYRNIFKSTFLFGFVQIFNIAVKAGINKVVALLLGPAGMGTISLYNTTIHLLSVGAGLGINQSAVRDISEAKVTNNKEKLDETITFVKRIIRYTSILGVIIMSALSPLLSEWTFGNKEYTIPYLILSLAVGATIQTNGYRAINTGMRELRNVAYSTMWGALAGLLSGIPLYFFLGESGIVPSLVISSMVTLLIAKYYADKVRYFKVTMTLRESLLRSSNMIKMGIALMLMSFMITAAQLIVSSYISSRGGLSIVGVYQAGATIVTSYFGIIISAMTTEYYPRISSFHDDNFKLYDAVNAQSEIGLLLALPLVILFVFLEPYFIIFLYSERFLEATQYLDFAVLGTVSIICSNSMGMILLAKQNSKLFLMSSLFGNIIIIIVNIILYSHLSIRGLGIAYMINGLMQFVIYDLIMRFYYNIHFNKYIVYTLIVVLFCSGLSSFIRLIDIEWLRWLSGLILFVVSCIYSIYQLSDKMDIKIISRLKSLLKND